jgi:hypothetical protein
VVVPVHDQEAWLPAALHSLRAQALTDWECVVVDDGSPGDVAAALGDALDDPRVRLERLERNQGLGAALNRGLDLTTAPYVAYLAGRRRACSADHLETLVAALDGAPGRRSRWPACGHGGGTPRRAASQGEPLQLVQVAHRRTGDAGPSAPSSRPTTSTACSGRGCSAGQEPVLTGRVTCTWTAHPRQRHKVLREPLGRAQPLPARYRVAGAAAAAEHRRPPARRGRALRALPRAAAGPPRGEDGLQGLLVGELAHNPERILALAERGHELHGLWTDTPVWFNTVGPLPFGHVAEVPRERWREAVRELQPDVVYGLLNWQAVPFAHEVLQADLGVPFVWHFKEGPWFSLQHGHWPLLADLHLRADGVVYSSPELRDWFGVTLPGTRGGRATSSTATCPRRSGSRASSRRCCPSRTARSTPSSPAGRWARRPRCSASSPGPACTCTSTPRRSTRRCATGSRRAAASHRTTCHLHAQVDQADWVRVFSQYDAGWLHDIRSTNGGDLHAATWDDLNYPARMGTLAAAGVPMLQRDNAGHVVATQALCRERDLGLLWREPADLVDALTDRERMSLLRKSVWSQREHFTFDAHVDELVGFFRARIAERAGG